jgi:hypothetical protein
MARLARSTACSRSNKLLSGVTDAAANHSCMHGALCDWQYPSSENWNMGRNPRYPALSHLARHIPLVDAVERVTNYVELP